jgi:hypothetical protein
MGDETESMCDECRRLVGAGRHTPPHSILRPIGELREFAAYGNRADEQRYNAQSAERVGYARPATPDTDGSEQAVQAR